MALELQVLTTYVKADPGGQLTSITADQVDWTGLTRLNSTHLTDDKGAGNIDMTKLAFNFVQKSISTVASSLYAIFAASTVANDIVGMGDVPRLIVYGAPSVNNNDKFFLAIGYPPGASWSDSTVNTGVNTERLMVGSVTPDGLTWTLIIYAGAVVGAEFDILTATGAAQVPNTRYTYAVSSFKTGATPYACTGYGRTYYVDIDGVAPSGIAITPHYFRRVR